MAKQKIDKTDRELISLLNQGSGRETLTKLGEELALIRGSPMSHVSVKKRIEKLKDNKIIQIQSNINARLLEYHSAFILLQTHDYETQKRIIERFNLCPKVMTIDVITGKYNMMLRVISDSQNGIQCFLNKGWFKKENISDFEIYTSNNNIKPQFLPIQSIPTKGKRHMQSGCGVKCQLCELFKDNVCPGCPAGDWEEKEED